MKRYYVSDVIGDGSFNNPYRAAASAVAQAQTAAGNTSNSVAIVPTDPTTGKPLFTWALCLVASRNHQPFLADTRLNAMPDVTLDTKVNAVATATLNAAQAALQGRSISTSFISNSSGYRDFINGIGQQLQSVFSVDSFDVSDV